MSKSDTITLQKAAKLGHRFRFYAGRVWSRDSGQRVVMGTQAAGLRPTTFGAYLGSKDALGNDRDRNKDTSLDEALDRARARGAPIGNEAFPQLKGGAQTPVITRKKRT